VVLPNPDDEESHNARKEMGRAKKQRRRGREKAGMVQEAQLGGLSAGGTIRLLPLGNATEPFVPRLL
jgi:hypothetical protein